MQFSETTLWEITLALKHTVTWKYCVQVDYGWWIRVEEIKYDEYDNDNNNRIMSHTQIVNTK